jgi:hypothetical protein
MALDLLSLQRQFIGKQKYLQLPKDEDAVAIIEDKKACIVNAAASPSFIIGYSVLFFWTVALTSARWSSFTFRDRLPEHSLQMYCMCSEFELNFMCQSLPLSAHLQDIVEYEHNVFNRGFWNEATIYTGVPNVENTKA